MNRQPVAIIAGTRPEVIKLAPVIKALQASRRLRPVLVATSQHGSLAQPAFSEFGLEPDADLKVMRREQSLSALSSRLISRLGDWLGRHRIAAVLVQGDTTSALMGALAAFYHQIPIGHVEAGLRTGDVRSPFPEEMNRRLITALATWHFAPTPQAARRLREEGVSPRVSFLTGNTIVDALHARSTRSDRHLLTDVLGQHNLRRRLILVTCHRRESHGGPLRAIGSTLRRLALAHPELLILFPVHPNPAVTRAVLPRLRQLPNVILSPPLDYAPFRACLRHAYLVMSDSGGVQEEATALGKPVLVLRGKTERQEGVRAGTLKLVGTNPARILFECERLLANPATYRRMARPSRVFGDGHAARRIVAILEDKLTRISAAAPERLEFTL